MCKTSPPKKTCRDVLSVVELSSYYLEQALRLMLNAIVSKTGLAPGVDPARLRPYVQARQTLSKLTMADEELPQDVKQELLAAVAQVPD